MDIKVLPKPQDAKFSPKAVPRVLFNILLKLFQELFQTQLDPRAIDNLLIHQNLKIYNLNI